jgi:hypothetical protein
VQNGEIFNFAMFIKMLISSSMPMKQSKTLLAIHQKFILTDAILFLFRYSLKTLYKINNYIV